MASTSTDKPVRNTKTPMRIMSLTNISESETELIKIEFNEKLNAHFLLTKNSEESSITSNLSTFPTPCRESLNALMQKIKREEDNARLDSSYINKYRNNYRIVECKDGKEQVFFKGVDDKFKLLIAWEDMFDIFWKTHLKYCHPKANTLKLVLQRDYIVNDFAIETLNKVCYTCSGVKMPYYRCALDFISMKTPDYTFSHMMIYQDMRTGFIHLRPICDDNKESEICIELFKIFMDFGPPKQVCISHGIFLKALDQIKHLTAYAPIPIHVTKVTPNQDRLNILGEKIRSWMKINKLKRWSIATYGAQLHLNVESKNGRKSSYDSVFKEIKTGFVEDLTEVGFDSCAFAGPSNATVDKEAFKASPIDNNKSFIEKTEPDIPDSNSPDEVQDNDVTYVALETEFNAPSEDEMVKNEDEDPATVDNEAFTASPTDNNESFIEKTEPDIPDSNSTDEVQDNDVTYVALETEFNAPSEDEMVKSEDENPVTVDKEAFRASPIDYNESFIEKTEPDIPDSNSPDEVQDNDVTYIALETDFNAPSEDEMVKSDDEDPLAID